MLIVDGHLDLAFNALSDGRDFLMSAHAVREAEAGGPVPEINGVCMVGLPECLAGGVALIFSTLTAIPAEDARPGELGYANIETAHTQALAQLGICRGWAEGHPQVSIVADRRQLQDVLDSWSGWPAQSQDQRRLGMVLMIENADVIRTPDEVAFWLEQGVRMVGPAWHSNRYTGSTIEPGPLTDLGRELLVEMQLAGMILDLSHMADEACLEALETYAGPIVATHANPRRLVPINRLLPDEIIRGIVERDGVIGIMPLNWALDPDWRTKTKSDIHLDAVVDAIDIVCQISGDALHVGIGSDFDGGQGAEAAPAELDTIADLPKLTEVLLDRGYDDAAVRAIMGGNWLRVLERSFTTPI